MLNLLPFLMCGGGGSAPAPYSPPTVTAAPARKKQPSKTAMLKQGGVRGATQAETGSPGTGMGGTLLTGIQGIGDASLTTGKTILGG